jgi:hypothetical protein
LRRIMNENHSCYVIPWPTTNIFSPTGQHLINTGPQTQNIYKLLWISLNKSRTRAQLRCLD